MSDLTKCADWGCLMRASCLRFCAPSKPEQSFADFGRQRKGNACAYYIHVSDKEKRVWQRGSAKGSASGKTARSSEPAESST